MRPVTKMVWLFVLIALASALFFVILDDEDVKSAEPAGASSQMSGSR